MARSFQEILAESRQKESVNLEAAYKALADQVNSEQISKEQAETIADALQASQSSAPETIVTNSENFDAKGSSASL